MSRLRALRAIAGLWLIAAAASASAQSTPPVLHPDDAVEAYLERLGASRLLAEQLAQRLAGAPREERVALAERLGKMYVKLLTDAQTPDDRAQWEQRGRDLLKDVPEADTSELRLSLNKAVYIRAEEIAERMRLRLAEPAEAQEAERQLRALLAEFETIAGRANQRVQSLERLEKSGEATEQLSSELASARRIRSLAYFYAGWSHVYISMLSGQKQEAVDALRCFGWLLNAPNGRPASPDRMPTALLKYEHIARSGIGSAVASGLRGEDSDAVRWLDLIDESDEISDAVREQLVIRRIAILGDAKRWADLEFFLRRQRKSDRNGGGKDVVPLAVRPARLLAVIVLEADKRVAGQEIEGLAKMALGDLVARQETGQVLDLMRRYGTAPIGDSGFIVFYVRGLIQYEQAREAHRTQEKDADEPTHEAATANLYRAAAKMLEASLKQSDAEDFAEDRVKAAVSLGRSRFFVGEAAAAADDFAAAWELCSKLPAEKARSVAQDAEEALWLAVVSMERAAKDQPVESSQARRRDELAALFLQMYPDSPRAARIVLMQSGSSEMTDDEAVRILSEVPKSSPVYEQSRRQLSRVLYNRFRSARGADRDFAAMRFVGVAEELLAADRKTAMEAGSAAAKEASERLMTRARQMLDALLGVTSPDVQRARAVLEVVQGVAQFNNLDLTPHEPELTFRRVQIALATNQDDAAVQLVERLGTLGPGAIQFAHAADRLIYKRALAKWKQSTAGDADSTAALADARSVVRLGSRVIERIGSGKDALADPAVLGVYAAVAQAAADLSRHAVDDATAMRELSIRMDEAILRAQPRAGESLRRLASTAEAAGDLARAAECWRTIVAAAVQGTPGWFEARYESLRVVSKIDPAKGREWLAQHRLLYPDGGPAPWGEKIRALGEELDRSKPATPPAPQGVGNAARNADQKGGPS